MALMTGICPNCKQPSNGGHFVPPSLGDPGFFACEAINMHGRKGESLATSRECTLDEWVDGLPEGHGARKELAALRSQDPYADQLRAALADLIRLKDLKDEANEELDRLHPDDEASSNDCYRRLDEHDRLKPQAWAAARAALAKNPINGSHGVDAGSRPTAESSPATASAGSVVAPTPHPNSPAIGSEFPELDYRGEYESAEAFICQLMDVSGTQLRSDEYGRDSLLKRVQYLASLALPATGQLPEGGDSRG